MLFGCAINDLRDNQVHMEALTVTDMGFFQMADSISYKDEGTVVSDVGVNGLSEISIIKGKTALSIYVSSASLFCAEDQGVEISTFIRSTMPKNSWYRPREPQTVELVLTRVKNFEIRNYFLTTPRFYINFDPCEHRSKSAIQKSLLSALETVFHELSHIRINSDSLFVNNLNLKQEETYASSIGLCVTLLSPYVKKYKFNTEVEKKLEFYNTKFDKDDPRHSSTYGSLKAQRLFNEALGNEKGIVETEKDKNEITEYCSTIFNSDY